MGWKMAKYDLRIFGLVCILYFVYMLFWFLPICISYTVFPHIVSALDYFPPLNSVRTFMYCDLWSYVLWSLDFQNKKRIVFAKIIWGDTVGCVDFLCVSKPAHGELPEKSRKLKGALTLYIDHSRSKQRTDQMVLELTLKFLGKKSSSSNSIFQTGELEKSSSDRCIASRLIFFSNFHLWNPSCCFQVHTLNIFRVEAALFFQG